MITHKSSLPRNFDADGYKAALHCKSISHDNPILVLNDHCDVSVLILKARQNVQKIAALEEGLV